MYLSREFGDRIGKAPDAPNRIAVSVHEWKESVPGRNLKGKWGCLLSYEQD